MLQERGFGCGCDKIWLKLRCGFVKMRSSESVNYQSCILDVDVAEGKKNKDLDEDVTRFG